MIPALAASAASKPKRAHAAPVPVKISLTPRAPEPDGPAGADADVSSSDDSVSSSSSGDDFASALPTALAPMPSDPRSRHSYPIRASDQAMMDPPSGHRRQQRSSTDQVSVQPPGVQQQPAQQQLSRTNQLEEQQRFSASDAEKQVQSDSAAVVETTMGQYAIGPSASDSKYSSVGKANSSVTSPISASDDGDVGRSMPDPISPLDSLGDSPERITVPTLLAVGPRGPIGGGEEPSRRPRHSPSPAPSVGETLLPNPLPMPILLHARPPPPEKTFARAAGQSMHLYLLYVHTCLCNDCRGCRVCKRAMHHYWSLFDVPHCSFVYGVVCFQVWR